VTRGGRFASIRSRTWVRSGVRSGVGTGRVLASGEVRGAVMAPEGGGATRMGVRRSGPPPRGGAVRCYQVQPVPQVRETVPLVFFWYENTVPDLLLLVSV
jgi:hypothetical protein